ncbi:MAG: NfeD family protein [Halanaerobium sp.]
MLKRILILLILILTIITFLPHQQKASALIYHTKLDGEINTAQYSFISDSLERAEEENAELFILEINSLGGFVDPALKIRDRIFISPMRIVTFINGRAWSAAALIAMAGEELYVSSGSSIGAAETRPNEEKYISALRKEFSATAEKRGKDGQIAEAMVDADISIPDLIEENKLLTLTAQESLNLGIADYMAANLRQIRENENLASLEINTINKSNLQELTFILTNPYVSALLLVIAFSALIFEALTPGFAVGGTIGIIALMIFFAGHILTGSIGTGMLILFFIGILLILVEVFIIPGFGIAGISGITAVLVSLFFVFPNRAIAINVLLAVIFFTMLIAYIMFKKIDKSQFWNKISLDTDSREYFTSSNKKKYLGAEALTITKLRPAGIIDIDGNRVDAVSEGSFIDKNVEVKVISVSGNRVVVRKIDEED